MTSFGQILSRGITFATLSVAIAIPAQAQIFDNLSNPERLNQTVLTEGNKFRICQFNNSETQELDTAIGNAIADTLLLESSHHMIRGSFGIGGENAADEMFIQLYNDCDVIMGMGLKAGSVPPEFTVTRPYIGYSYMLLASDENIKTIEDIPYGSWIGGQLGSYGDYLLNLLINVRPNNKTWKRLPYGDNNLMMNRVLDGTAKAAVIFGPSWRTLSQTRDDIDLFHELPIIPELNAEANIGAIMSSAQTFMRQEVDKAITDMVADGTIERLVKETGFDMITAVPGGF